MRIELRQVGKRFGRVRALEGLSLALEPGSKVALIGPNGSGKSTLTRVIMGILACEGEVLLDGVSPHRERLRVAGSMAYVPQTAPQLGATVGEVVAVIRELRGLDPEALRGAAARLDLDLESVAGRPVRALSGGMRQKLLIALALSTGASLLILDEPTASLDAPARQAFFGLMEERARSATVLLCSHRLEEVRHLVDHVVALRGGRVAYAGPVEEYLRARAFSVVELYTEGSTLDPWLSARGFRRGAPGSWARTVSHGEKAGLLREVLATFNGQLRNLVVRDLDALEDGAVPPTSAGAEPLAPEGAEGVEITAPALGARAGDRP